MLFLLFAPGAVISFGNRENAKAASKLGWDELPQFSMRGGLKVFWDIGDGNGRGHGENWQQAIAHGFLPITEFEIFTDYPGQQRENINDFLGKRPINPWDKPLFFESTVRRNIEMLGSAGVHVHDIEFVFEHDVDKAWQSRAVRAASSAKDRNQFEAVYFKEWATWYTLPALWTREKYPEAKVGLYGIQPFSRDYVGVVNKSQKEIDKAHEKDDIIWQYIDPFVDFYIADIYVYSENPLSFVKKPDYFMFMALNVEENYLRSRKYGDKPVYAYEWLRFHDSSPRTGEYEHSPEMVEAMAVIPFFFGAKGIVLWGYEPQLKAGDGRPYEQLPLFMKTLSRIALLSEQIGQARLAIDEPASKLWQQKRPLLRRMITEKGQCIVMAINPWQEAEAQSEMQVACGGRAYMVTMRGGHPTLAYIDERGVTEY